MLQIGQTLGKYRIEGIIGEGAFGQVVKAWDTSLKRLVAIKELRRDAPGMGSTAFDEYAGRFRREAQVQAQFNHPHIVHVYELIDQGDTLYLVMEYVEGKDLREVMAERGPLAVDEAVRIAVEVLEALAAVHEHPLDVVHRDVKPSNVLLTARGQAKLSDFGLAQVAAESGRSMGAGGHHPGTPLYMSPEQERTRAYLKARSDLYSVGCVLFELLTGELYKRQEEGTPPSALRTEVPPGLDAVVLKALAEDERARYQRAGEMAAALRALTPSPAPSPLPRAGEGRGAAARPERPLTSPPGPSPSPRSGGSPRSRGEGEGGGEGKGGLLPSRLFPWAVGGAGL
ncbi:MAG: serine/threonine protein kinase, partial [Anaerolineae bacterium]|nr:serine/threonine protein kinase [Anaerolineae bacterium]